MEGNFGEEFGEDFFDVEGFGVVYGGELFVEFDLEVGVYVCCIVVEVDLEVLVVKDFFFFVKDGVCEFGVEFGFFVIGVWGNERDYESFVGGGCF